ncbi:MAG: LPS sulfotransferase NodH [Bacteroidia bacterium]|jgi:LPS sulfotransferase NodH
MGVKFVIVGAPRTGSTLLVRTLNQLSGVCCHGELLQLKMVRGYEDGFNPEKHIAQEREARTQRLLAERDADPVEFIRQALNTDAAATGMKITYDVFFKPEWESVVDLLISEGNIKFIHLIRNNGLRRYVSEEILYAGGPNHSAPGGRSQETMQIDIDVDAFIARQKLMLANGDSFRARVAGLPLHELSYEELAQDIADSISRICQFLDPGIDATGIVPALEKVGAADLRQSVSNYQDLLQHEATQNLALRD